MNASFITALQSQPMNVKAYYLKGSHDLPLIILMALQPKEKPFIFTIHSFANTLINTVRLIRLQWDIHDPIEYSYSEEVSILRYYLPFEIKKYLRDTHNEEEKTQRKNMNGLPFSQMHLIKAHQKIPFLISSPVQ